MKGKIPTDGRNTVIVTSDIPEAAQVIVHPNGRHTVIHSTETHTIVTGSGGLHTSLSQGQLSLIWFLPDDGYGSMIKAGITKALERMNKPSGS